MSERTAKPIGIAFIVALLLFVGWYIEAEDFSEQKIADTYVLAHDDIRQTVTLRQDHTFEQQDVKQGVSTHASGTWRYVSSRGLVAFSKDFIDAPEVRRSKETGDVYAIFKNYLGLVSITMDDNTTQIKAYKKLFS